MSEHDTYLRRYPPMTDRELSGLRVDIASLAQEMEGLSRTAWDASAGRDRVDIDTRLLDLRSHLEQAIVEVDELRARIGENVR